MKHLIHRDILIELKNHLPHKEITLLTGPRRAGKTTLLTILMDGLGKQGEQTYYVNLDRESDFQLYESQEKVIFFIAQNVKTLHNKQRLYLFIDEIQRKENAGLFLKGIYDYIDVERLPVKLVVTGSGSLELKEKIHESLAGRKRIFHVGTVSFYEWVKHKHHLADAREILEFARLFEEQLHATLLEYLRYGGYPDVLLEEDITEKKKILKEIYDSYIEKDVQQLLRIEKTKAFSHITTLLAAQVGNIVNKAELARVVGISQNTVDTYLWYLEKTWILTLIPPFYWNPRKEITKMPVVYFNDLGMRSLSIGQFYEEKETAITGFMFENFIFRMLNDNHATGEKIHFWRSTIGAEVDFIIGTYLHPIPVEVKMKRFSGKPRYGKSIYSFIRKYKPPHAYLYNLDTSHTETIRGTTVNSLRYFELPKQHA